MPVALCSSVKGQTAQNDSSKQQLSYSLEQTKTLKFSLEQE
jgi:hypothetical protein